MKSRDKKSRRDAAPLTTPSELINLGSGIGEVAVDALLENGFVRELPVIKSAVSFVRAGRALRDQIFLRKIARFLDPLDETTAEERVKFANDMDAVEGGRARLGENLVLLLERLDNMQKPEMIGRIYLAHIRGLLTWRELQLLSAAIDRLNLGYFDDLVNYYSLGGPKVDDLALQHLANCGLIRIVFGGAGESACYAKTDLGYTALSVLRTG